MGASGGALLDEVAATSEDVAAISSRLKKVERLSALLAQLDPQEVPVAVAYLSGTLPQGSIGVGWASLRDVPTPSAAPTLHILDVDGALRRIGALAGAGSQTARKAELRDLFGRASEREQRFLRNLLMGEVRQGALEGVMVDAIARASGVPVTALRRAAMLAGDLGVVGAAAMRGGAPARGGVGVAPPRPRPPRRAPAAGGRAAPRARGWARRRRGRPAPPPRSATSA